jgi:hypothetical protein
METIDYTSSGTARSKADDATRRQQILTIGVLALLLIAGLGFGVWRWEKNRKPDEPLVDVAMGPGDWMATRRGMMQPPPPREGVAKVGDSYRLRNGDAVMYVSQLKNGTRQFSFSYQPQRYMSGPDAAILLARINSLSLELTKEQLERLDKLGPFSSGMVVSDADREKMASLWEAYLKADASAQPAAENALKTALTEVADRSAEPTKANIQNRVSQIKQILTPQQVEKLSTPQNRRGVNRAPASQPVP